MSDGSYYEGDFDNGEINGFGFRFFASTGNSYSGEFHAGEIHGQGVMHYADGSTYEGEWENWKLNGKGTFIYASGPWKGCRYEGEFVKNKLNLFQEHPLHPLLHQIQLGQ